MKRKLKADFMPKKLNHSKAVAQPLPDTAPLRRIRNNELLLNPLPDLYFRTDAKGTILEYGGEEVGRLAIPSNKLNGGNISQVLPAKEVRILLPAIARTIRHQQPTQLEYSLTIESQLRHYEARLLPVADKHVAVLVLDVTIRKQEQEELQLSKDRFQALATISPAGIFQSQPNGYTTYVNPQWCQTAGLSSAEAMGNGWVKAIHPDDRKLITTGWNKAVRKKTSSSAMYRFLHRDGTVRWVIGQAAPQQGSKGQLVGYVGIITDITDLKKAEEAIKSSQELSRAIIDHSPIGIAIREKNGKLVSYNQTWERIWSMPKKMIDEMKQEMNPNRISNIYAYVPEHLPGILKVFRYGSTYSIPDIHIKNPRPGQAEWINQYFYTIWDKKGGIDKIVVLVEDITDRKKAEKQLLESESKYRQIYEGVAEGVFRSTPSGDLLLANPALVKMLGYKNFNELRKHNVGAQEYSNPEVRRRYQELMERDGMVRDFVNTWRSKDGKELVVNENAHVVRDDQGQVLYHEGTVEDITSHIKADLALLDEKNKMTQLFEVSLEVARAGTIQQKLELTIIALKELNLFKRMALVVKNDEGQNVHVAHLGLEPQEVDLIKSAPAATEEARSKIFDPRFRYSNSYFIPHDATEARQNFSAVLEAPSYLKGEWHPFDSLIVPMTIQSKFVGYISADQPVDGRIPSIETIRLLELYANQAAIAIENLRLYDNLEASYHDTLKAFVAAMEAKDPYTKGHSENVQNYAITLARHLNLSEERVRIVDYSSLLHDIGKIGLKEDILNKPATLTEDEYDEVKQHPLLGGQMVSRIENLRTSAQIVRSHHEHYDGRGYPDGLHGEQIPLEARIIKVADAYEAMTSNRPYRDALTSEEALIRLELGAGRDFDKALVDAFIELVRSGKISATAA